MLAFVFLGLLLGTTATHTPPPLTPPGTYTSYQLGPVCSPTGAIQSPINADQVQSIVKRAIANNQKVKAFGARHSLSDIICTDGVAIDMSNFKGLTLNPDNTVTAGAGIKLRELGEFLHQHGRALQVTPAYGGITIGGAIGTGAHGSTLKYESSISEQTVGLTIVDGIGTIQNITDPTQLNAFRVHLGMIGVILSATIVTVPDFKETVHNYEVSDSILTNGEWLTMAKTSDSFILYWFPSIGRVVISNGTFVPVSTPGNCYSNDHVPPTTKSFNALSSPGLEILQTLNSDAGMYILERYLQQTLLIQVPDFVPIYTEDNVILQNPGTGYPYMMMDAICNSADLPDFNNTLDCAWFHYPNNVTFMDNEVSVAIEDMTALITSVKDILSKTTASFALQGILLRFSKGTTTYMSSANGKDVIHFEYYPFKRKNQYENPILGGTAYQVLMQVLANTYHGIPHWGKNGMYYHSREIIQKNINSASLSAFVAQMQQIDPNQIFMNDFGRRLLNLSDVMNTDPLTTHCALLDNCICKNNADCANGQVCGTIPGYPNYKTCITPGLTLPDLSGLLLPFPTITQFLQCLAGPTPLACISPLLSLPGPLLG